MLIAPSISSRDTYQAILPSPVWAEIGVGGRELVASNAMSLSRMDGARTDPPQDVLPLCNRLQMFGVNAVANAAQVIELHPLRDGTDQQFVSVAMDASDASFASAQTEDAVTVSDRTRPKPTVRGFLNLRPETLFRGLATVRRCAFGAADCMRVMRVITLVLHREPILSGVTGRDVQASPLHYFSMVAK